MKTSKLNRILRSYYLIMFSCLLFSVEVRAENCQCQVHVRWARFLSNPVPITKTPYDPTGWISIGEADNYRKCARKCKNLVTKLSTDEPLESSFENIFFKSFKYGLCHHGHYFYLQFRGSGAVAEIPYKNVICNNENGEGVFLADIRSKISSCHPIDNYGTCDSEIKEFVNFCSKRFEKACSNPFDQNTGEELNISISSPTNQNCYCKTKSFSVNVTGGTPPYEITWYKSNNMQTWDQVGTGFNLDMPLPCEVTNVPLWIKVKVQPTNAPPKILTQMLTLTTCN